MPKPPITFIEQQIQIQRWNRGYHRDDGPSIVYLPNLPRQGPRQMRMAWYNIVPTARLNKFICLGAVPRPGS